MTNGSPEDSYLARGRDQCCWSTVAMTPIGSESLFVSMAPGRTSPKTKSERGAMLWSASLPRSELGRALLQQDQAPPPGRKRFTIAGGSRECQKDILAGPRADLISRLHSLRTVKSRLSTTKRPTKKRCKLRNSAIISRRKPEMGGIPSPAPITLLCIVSKYVYERIELSQGRYCLFQIRLV